jgi:DNA-directed RNA polymerase alpha subunit
MGCKTSYPIAQLPLPRRAINALRHGGIQTVEETEDWPDHALLSLPQFGPAFLAALRSAARQVSEH